MEMVQILSSHLAKNRKISLNMNSNFSSTTCGGVRIASAIIFCNNALHLILKLFADLIQNHDFCRNCENLRRVLRKFDYFEANLMIFLILMYSFSSMSFNSLGHSSIVNPPTATTPAIIEQRPKRSKILFSEMK